ncbi:hypothetical protein Rhopal_005209-T1 [Rhodotorula paludigena]|uniref:Brix domain-containing protein n=1 Tax=Rhodotorula paludigena TaxID=86838 RepID=A0AAV5GSG9_9BASI|nr:hypothetical protein Rhopal_005209-T1 [Rhodotorula paludigena]
MPLKAADISRVRNKVVRSQLNEKRKKDQRQAKLKKRIARKEAEARGETVERQIPRTIENTREWLGDEDGEYADPRTRPAPVSVNEDTGDVTVDMGSLSNLFPLAPDHPEPSTSGLPPPEPKVLITTSPGKPPAPFTRQFLEDFQALLGGKTRADVVPRRSPKFELSRVARWARKRGYGAIAVVGEDHAKPTTLTVSQLPYGPTAHFRLTGITLCKDIPGHASPTSHPPELVLNHFSTPLGLSLATLLSQLFLPPAHAARLQQQGFAGRQVVLAQNSRDFVFIRRYRYMFALKSHRLGKTKKSVSDVPRMTEPNPEHEVDDTVKTRFQEIGPQMTLKMRWIRRGPLGETGNERELRERYEAETGEQAQEFGEEAGQPGAEGEEGDEMDLDGELGGREDGDGGEGARDDEDDDAEAEEEAKRAIGLDAADSTGQPNFPPSPADASAAPPAAAADASPADGPANPKKRPRTTPRVRKKPYHALLNPPPSNSPSPEPEAVPLPTIGKKKNKDLESAIETVGKTWHAGKGEGGVRESAKRREWNWEAKMQVSRRKFFL